MPSLTRADLERAAVNFFAELAEEVDQPRHFHPTFMDEDVELNKDASRQRATELVDQLKSNVFDRRVRIAAEELARRAGRSFGALAERQKLMACKLAARVEIAQMELLSHALTDPVAVFEPHDALFSDFSAGSIVAPASGPVATFPERSAGPSLSEIVTRHVHGKKARGLSQSQIDEVTRALLWLLERFGRDRDLRSIQKRELANFRDDLARLDVTQRGRKAPFEDRLTNRVSEQIKSVTARRYWRSVQAFFAWTLAEGFADTDPSSGLLLQSRKGETKHSPTPFSENELRAFCKTSLYSGYRSPKHVLEKGRCHRRSGRWWAAIVMMFTGLRAGELSQLLPSDFVFEVDIPHVKVREEDETGKKIKSAKTQASIRDVPLSPILLELGIRQFVESRAKRYPQERVFREFRLGTRGRVSDGMSKFWTRYLKVFGLWSPGRATHVWRHTVVANLRANEVAEEDIAALVGHSRGTMTSRYGGDYPLARKMKTAERIDFGFDVVAALGGEYIEAVHSEIPAS